jgi:hypothetical protein
VNSGSLSRSSGENFVKSPPRKGVFRPAQPFAEIKETDPGLGAVRKSPKIALGKLDPGNDPQILGKILNLQWGHFAGEIANEQRMKNGVFIKHLFDDFRLPFDRVRWKISQ